MSREQILPTHWKENSFLNKMKKINKLQHIMNGNLKNTLKVIHWNLGSKKWNRKLVEIGNLLDEHKPDLCYISEANLWEDLDSHERELPGHHLVLPNTMEYTKHARLVLIVKDGIDVVKLNQYMDRDISTIWVKVGKNGRKGLRIGGIYREHSVLGITDRNETWQVLQEQMEDRWRRIVTKWEAAGNGTNCVVVGDLNLDQVKWLNPDQHQANMVELVQNTIEVAGHTQIVSGITRCWKQQADSLIDHIWVNCNDLIIDHFNKVRSDSDHNLIGLNISLRKIKKGGQNIKKTKWGQFNESRFKDKLRTADWGSILLETDPNIANDKFGKMYRQILDSEAPMSIIQTRCRYNNWLRSETKLRMTARDSARETARLTQRDTDWNEYKLLRNECTRLQRSDKTSKLESMYKKMENENDSSALYGMTKTLLGWKTSGPPVRLNIGGRTMTKQNDIANAQAGFYKDKVDRIKENLPRVRFDPLKLLRQAFNQWIPDGRISDFKIKPVTEIEIIKMLKEHKNSHAFGDDLIDAGSLKKGKEILAKPIAWIVNLSLGTGEFVTEWKVARVLPLLKGKDCDQTNPASYRPVSQLSVLSKLAEITVQRQLLEHLETTNQLSGDHHAYRKWTSTTTALLQMVDCIARGIDENKIVSTMCVDLTAAFDCVEHQLLIEKLQFYSIDESTLKWIKSYLADRTSYVAIGSGSSNKYKNLHGVPQGSVLGPLMYLVYMNELALTARDDECKNEAHDNTEKLFGNHCESCGSLTIFADDLQYLKTSNRRAENKVKITENFQRIVNFLNSAGLEVNQAKTNITEYMSRQKRGRIQGDPPSLKVDVVIENKIVEKIVTNKEYCRTLGSNIKQDLSWDMHLSSGDKALLPAIRKQLGAISSLRGSLPQKAKLKLVNGFILSKFNYIICLWGNTTQNQVRKAQICLNAAARFVLNAKRTERQSTLMSNCNWLTISERTQFQSLIQFFKVVRWRIPAYMTERIFLEVDDTAFTSVPRLKLTADSWRCKTTLRWNLLPIELRVETDIILFKKALKRHLIEIRDTAQIDDSED